ncbi:MAG: BofC C-terminal domain-containing protein [Bacillota bacterium]
MSRKSKLLLISLTIFIFFFLFLNNLNIKDDSNDNNYRAENPNFNLTIVSESMKTHLEDIENEFYNQQNDIVSDLNLNKNFNQNLVADDYRYLGVKDGKIAIFKKDDSGEILQEVTSINLNDLPEKEREELKEGIIVSSDEELIKILEGLVSYSED